MKANTSTLNDITRRAHILLWDKLPRSGAIHADLRGACAIGAYVLREMLWRAGITSKLVVGFDEDDEPEHVWVRVGKYHLDPTYSQFGDLPYLVSQDPPEGYDPREIPLPDDWPDDQHPKTFWALLGLGEWP